MARARVVLIHWNKKEAEERGKALKDIGYDVNCHWESGSPSMRQFLDDPPDCFVIDLNRLPSQGRDVGVWFRSRAATRRVPLVLIRGDEEKTSSVRSLLHDAVFTSWDDIADSLKFAMESPPVNPVVPNAMAGYSGTPLPKKLGIRADSQVVLLGAPQEFMETLGALPHGVHIRKRSGKPGSVVLLFVRNQKELIKRFPSAKEAIAPGGRLWIAWPKKASGVVSDLTQVNVRAFGLNAGLVDYKISAIDKTWSALCFAVRRHD